MNQRYSESPEPENIPQRKLIFQDVVEVSPRDESSSEERELATGVCFVSPCSISTPFEPDI